MLKKIQKNYYLLSTKLNEIFSNKKVNLITLIVYCFFIFVLFYFITKSTPLAGDDWGYAINGSKGNPFSTALQFYQTWSGRFFSELWGFLVAPNKELWNIINPLFFFTIFIIAINLTSTKRSYIINGILILFLMLRVSNNLRMETYTWIMGTTYVIPLMLTLLYFLLVEKKIIHVKDNIINLVTLITSLLSFYVGLTMENIAVALIGAQILFLLHYHYHFKTLNKNIFINILFSTISLLVMRSSPGSQARLLRDHAIWNQQGIFTKIVNNIPSFVKFTFVDNRYLIFILSFILIALVMKRVLRSWKFRNIIGSSVLFIYFVVVMAVVGANTLVTFLNLQFMSIFLDLENKMVWLFWLLYIFVVIYVIFKFVDNNKSKQKIIFFILVGGAANTSMLLSPIFGSRSSLYFVYFLIIAIILLFNELRVTNGNILLVLFLTLVILVHQSTMNYYLKYEKVNQIQEERLAIIQYYLDNPQIQEIHIPRMPPNSIHSADIEIGDKYHFDTFKMYYGLNPDAVIIFDWKNSYN